MGDGETTDTPERTEGEAPNGDTTTEGGARPESAEGERECVKWGLNVETGEYECVEWKEVEK